MSIRPQIPSSFRIADERKDSKLVSTVEWIVPQKNSDVTRHTLEVIPENHVTVLRKLPLFGPLNISNVQAYLHEAKVKFERLYSISTPDVVSRSDFQMLAVIGRGAFGKVILVRNKKEKMFYAMKALLKRHIYRTNQMDHTLNEKRVLQSIDFPFAVRLEYFAKDNSYIYLFMPFVPGGEMFSHLRKVNKFDENQSRFYAAQVVMGLDYLHHLKLVYRDLKPENLLLDQYGYLKITDFGFCKYVPSRTYTFCGTPHYLAPEIITGHGYGMSCDWWSLGILIYEMNAGHPPFDDDDQMTMYKHIVSGRYMMPPHLTVPLRDLITKLLQSDFTKRLGVLHGRVEAIKRHEWFKPINWLKVFNRRLTAPYVPLTSGPDDISHFPTVQYPSLMDVSEENEYEEAFRDF